jgi:5-formyltetrahydrofolate cyclo-ligase
MEMKAARMSLSEAEVKDRSREIFIRWRNRFSLKRIGFFHCYQSISGRNEVDTGEIMQYVRQRHPQVLVVVPVVDWSRKSLRHALVHDSVEMRKNKFGIPEPHMPVDFIHPVQMDMVIVPMLAFDDHGNRLGYGAGYYDKFLALTRPKCLKIGFCFENGHLMEPLPVEPHDIPLDLVVTETNIIRFNQNLQI